MIPFTLPSILLLAHLSHAQSTSADLPSKRGLAFRGDEHEGDNNLILSDGSAVSWYYTWSLWPAPALGDALVFVPLMHGLDDAEDDELPRRLDALPESSTHLLTFNEPDGETDTGGSSISPEDAAEAYLEYIAPLRESARGRDRTWRISHPVVTSSDRGLEWLRDFNASCYDISDDGCPADFIAVHYYGPFAGLPGWVDTLRDFYADLAPSAPLWITEVALPQASADETLAMLNETIAYLDDDDGVEAYAWFGAFRTDEANEWTGDGVSFFNGEGELTDVGAQYLGGEEGGFETGMAGEDGDSSAPLLLPSSVLVAAGVIVAVLMA
ncbi:hypothetical protein S7711_03115 [Stachybotrys chartarum IBT 7711]|uniref:Asl1-like glycosyl hydrolase catalytic domain-containing protein n=1 Tax=Stachybotrys chartarum (strain CBS 109288 / IBT 7711) TaxID=1280523 RepID=A0A084B8D7_STACB|nr:hypothetical protein S7711_03115 [Stachybotrys chartarum IBT 7711]